MPALPNGVVTFLFSDIEASTRILEDHRAAAGPAFARHHELLAREIDAADGVVFETVGDAVYGAFTRPASALAAAVAIQRRMAAEDWSEVGTLRVRIAIHSGVVETRGDHYFGPALFECARMQALAHGDQTIASGETAALAVTLPAGIELQPLGLHRLKDLATPMEVVQVNGTGLPSQFPPLRSSIKVPSNLPDEMTSFIGRDEDLARLADLIGTHRLVTLVGPGGTGKTRLAIEAAARELDRFPDGVWLVELAPVMQPDRVMAEVADVWGLRPGEGSTLEEVVTRYLATRHLLLVVDNCEHVRNAVAALLQTVLRAAPEVTVVATSRETLGLPGEAAYRVPALGLPDDQDHAAASDAVRLFLERVHAARPDLIVSDADLDAIVRICRRLEGMPLGIELAAARIRILSPEELADRLDTSFLVLGSSKGAVDRQRTLEATLDWSHDLLTSDEQAVFRRLSVFVGGFDVGAAEIVCAADPVDAGALLDHLDSLVDKSLVLTVPGPRARFRLLEPIRQYAESRLRGSGEWDVILAAHARHYADLSRRAEPHIRGHRQLEWGHRLDADHDNLRTALVTLRETGEIDRYLEVCFDLWLWWQHDGMHQEGLEFTLAGLGSDGLADPIRVCKAWFVATILAFELSDPHSVEYAEKGIATAREVGDLGAVGRLTTALGFAIQNLTDRDDGDAFVLEGARLWLEHVAPSWWDLAWDDSYLALERGAFFPAGHPDRRRDLERAIRGFRVAGDLASTALALIITDNLSAFADDDWILANLEEAIGIARSSEYRHMLGHALYYWGAKMLARGQGESSRAALDEAAMILGDIGDAWCSNGAALQLIAVDAVTARRDAARLRLATLAQSPAALGGDRGIRCFDAACLLALESGEYEVAARLLGKAAQTPLQGVRGKEIPAYQARLEGVMHPIQLERLAAQGAAMTDEEALTAVVRWAGGGR